ncbi:MAG: hypothetical protein HN392_01670 [Anaerolineae bacterium]|nr:hypothetical protein [Anaerolineae bacterium]MBT7074558.1 hypothetical protein [Anaerolineae bacterium]MBT7783247.1 hypothetical protein [Anaerolineae bacterium]
MKKLYLLFTIIFTFAILVGVLLAANYTISPRLSGGEDFRVSWMGARAYLFDEANPYTVEVAREAQVEIYGRFAEEGEYPYRLDKPFYILFFYFPFAFMENFNLARALWMSFSEIALFGVGLLSIQLAGWKISRLNLALLFTALFLSFYGLYPLIIGAGSIFTTLIFLLVLLTLREKKDEALAILLFFSTIYLGSGGVLFFFILFILITSRRRRVFSVLSMSLIAIIGFSLIFFPDLPLSFLRATFANLRVAQGFLLSETLQIWRPKDGALIAEIIKWFSILLLIFEWITLHKRPFEHLLWGAGLSIAITPFLGIHATSNIYPLLFFPFVLVLKTVQSRWGSKEWIVSLAIISLFASWVIFWRTPDALKILAYLFPLLLIISLYWMRWWTIRPPRTWADKINLK